MTLAEIANKNALAILDRLGNGNMILIKREGVILMRFGPSNMPTLAQVVAACLEHQGAVAIEINIKTMREAPCAGFVAITKDQIGG
jgi:hypothetical protein